MKLLFLIDCAGIDQPTLIAAAVLRILSHYEVAKSAVGGWDWRFLRLKERGGRVSKVPFQAASADSFERFCDDISVHCGGGGAGGGLTHTGLRRIYHSLLESVGSYHWDASGVVGEAEGSRHVFIVSPCPTASEELRVSLKCSSTTTKGLAKQLTQSVFTHDLQKSFGSKRMALYWINVRPSNPTRHRDRVAEDCVREVLETRFAGSLVQLNTLCHASVLGVPVDVHAIISRGGRKGSHIGYGMFCASAFRVPPCCVLQLHPVFSRRHGSGLATRAELEGTVHHRESAKAEKLTQVSIRLEKGKSGTVARKRSMFLCPRGSIELRGLPALLTLDTKYFHALGVCQACLDTKNPDETAAPSRWFAGLLTQLAAASEGLLVDTVDPETGVPCTAVLRPVGPASALLITVGEAAVGAAVQSRMTHLGGQFLNGTHCLCGQEKSDAEVICDCAGGKHLDVSTGLFSAESAAVDSSLGAQVAPDGWLLAAMRGAAEPAPPLESIELPPLAKPSSLVQKCLRNAENFMKAESNTKGTRGSRRALSVTSNGLVDTLTALLQSSTRPRPQALALSFLSSTNELPENVHRNVSDTLRSLTDLECLLDSDSCPELDAISETVARDDYLVRLLQLQTILRLHMVRLIFQANPDGAHDTKQSESPGDLDPISPAALENDVVKLLDRLGPMMDLQDHSASVTSFMTHILVPTFAGTMDGVLRRVCDRLEMADALPPQLREIPLTSDAEVGPSSDGAARSSQGTSQPETDGDAAAVSEPEPEEAAPTARPRPTLGDKGAIKALTTRQITVFSKPANVSRRKSSKRRTSADKQARGGKGKKVKVMVTETPAKDLAAKTDRAQIVKRSRREFAVQESPAVQRAKQQHAERERLDRQAALGARRSPRIHRADAVGVKPSAVARLAGAGKAISPVPFNGSPRRSPRRRGAPPGGPDATKPGVKRVLNL